MNPIRSGRELQLAKRAVRDLRDQLAMLKQAYAGDRDAYELATAGLRRLLHETVQQIEAYEQSKAGDIPPVVGARNPRTGQLELPRLLRRLRLAAGLDQSELAVKMGTRQSNISRWEREGYDHYNLRGLVHLADVLGYDLEVAFVRRDETKGERK